MKTFMKTIMLTIIMVLFYSNVFAAGNCFNFFTQDTWGTCVRFSDCYDPEEGVVWWKWCENMPDADGDGIVDSDDPDTLYGFISGLNHVGVPITIARVVDVVGTDEDGYYAFGDLPPGEYLIVPSDDETWFFPRFQIVDVVP
jgi:hypothetical protein